MPAWQPALLDNLFPNANSCIPICFAKHDRHPCIHATNGRCPGLSALSFSSAKELCAGATAELSASQPHLHAHMFANMGKACLRSVSSGPAAAWRQGSHVLAQQRARGYAARMYLPDWGSEA